jgi:hypothetical protein
MNKSNVGFAATCSRRESTRCGSSTLARCVRLKSLWTREWDFLRPQGSSLAKPADCGGFSPSLPPYRAEARSFWLTAAATSFMLRPTRKSHCPVGSPGDASAFVRAPGLRERPPVASFAQCFRKGRIMSEFKVLIIGAGLGGLALAQSLSRAGVSVQIFERDHSPFDRPQGYRLHLDA